MMDSVVHVAGSVVRYEDRIIQRCVICGEKLVDNYGVPMPLNADGTVPEFPTWEPETLVRFQFKTDGMQLRIPLTRTKEELPDDLPDDSCIVLVE